MAERTNNKKTAIGWMGVTLMFDILLLLITIMRVDHQTIFLHHIICVDTASHNLSVLSLRTLTDAYQCFHLQAVLH